MTNEKLDSVVVNIILALAFLLPIFFIPSIILVPLQETKLFLLILGVLTSVALWTLARLKGSNIIIPQEKFILPIITLPFIALASSLFSGDILNSIIGQGIDVDTVLMMFVLTLGFGIGVYLFNSGDKIIKFYIAFTASALILFSYQFLKFIFGGDILSFNNLFTGVTSNLIGKWNDLAIFAGVITLISLITLDILKPEGLIKKLFYASFVASLIILVIVNFSLVWLVLGLVSFLLFIRSFLENKFFIQGNKKNKSTVLNGGNVSKLVLIVLVLSILFIFAGSIFGGILDTKLGISQIEARPSWQGTMSITKEAYSDNIIFGAGPNNFTKEWLLNKPASINNSPFWNVDFLFGIGIIPTLFITHGILSIVAWATFLALFFWAGIRMFVRLDLKPLDNYLSTSSFFSATFLWLLSIFYVPHIILFFFAFLFSGIFLATQINAGVVKQKTFEFNGNLRIGFIGIVILFTLLIFSVSSIYITSKKFVSLAYIGNASKQINIVGNIQAAEESIDRALLFSKNDLAYRSSAEISMFKLTNLVNQGSDTKEEQLQFQAILSEAIENSRLAVSVNRNNYQNYITSGRVYETLIPLGIQGTYDNARVFYEKALLLNPQNPRLELDLARIEVLNNNNDEARVHISNALNIKNDYINAIFLLSQIEINEGKVSEAIASIEAATFLAPQDQLAFFQLGILKYSEQDYSGAIEALERAVRLDNQYANARYFLGLSYYQVNRIQDAINQFDIVKRLNPNNTELVTVINNLKAGRAPFEDSTPPNDPFDGFELPVEEE